MPYGVGGVHRGPDDKLGVWGTIDALYDTRVDPAEFPPADDVRVVVIGR